MKCTLSTAKYAVLWWHKKGSINSNLLQATEQLEFNLSHMGTFGSRAVTKQPEEAVRLRKFLKEGRA